MEIHPTITSIFIVPTLKIPASDLTTNNFINGYIKDNKKDLQYENAVFLLFKPKDLNKFRIFLDKEYDRTKRLIDDYDYEDGFVVVVYQLDPLFNDDFTLIKQGKYSKTSKAFQALFPKIKKITYNGVSRDQISLQYRVFNRTQELIDYWEEKLGMKLEPGQEVWSGFIEENEVLNFNEIKEYISIK